MTLKRRIFHLLVVTIFAICGVAIFVFLGIALWAESTLFVKIAVSALIGTLACVIIGLVTEQ